MGEELRRLRHPRVTGVKRQQARIGFPEGPQQDALRLDRRLVDHLVQFHVSCSSSIYRRCRCRLRPLFASGAFFKSKGDRRPADPPCNAM